MEVWPGTPYPLGATWDGAGTNFALFSEVAEQVELCLFNAGDADEDGETRIAITEVDGLVWHCYLPGVEPGQRYGYRVHGPYQPERGHRCHPSKLLLDPYGKAVEGQVAWHQAVYSYQHGNPSVLNTDDSAPYMPRNVVINPFLSLPWYGAASPTTGATTRSRSSPRTTGTPRPARLMATSPSSRVRSRRCTRPASR